MVMIGLVSLSCMSLACFIILMNNPQSLIVLLIIQAFMISLLLSLVSSMWFSYILFLVFLGGMLVIFIYIMSLSSNIIIKSWLKNMEKMIVAVAILILMASYMNSEFLIISLADSPFMESSSIYVLMSSWSFVLYLFIVMYLLLALFNICGMLKMFNGPLRSFVY